MNMKLWGIVAGLLLLLAGCSNDEKAFEMQGDEGGLKTFSSFTATLDDVAGTRTYLDDSPSNGVRKMHWYEGDVISVYSDTDKQLKEFVLTNVSGDNLATFTGEEVTGNRFYAVYSPTYGFNVDEEDYNVVHFEWSTTSFKNGFLLDIPMVASSTDGTLAFKQTMGIIHVTVGNVRELGMVIISGNDNEIVGGSGYVNLSEAQPSFKLDYKETTQGFGPSNGTASYEGVFVDIYFAMPPIVFEKGFNISIDGSDAEGNVINFEKKYNSRFEVNVGTISSFSLVDITAELEAIHGNEIIDFADPIVKQICIENWDTNSDGELSYAEAAEVKDIGRTFTAGEESITRQMKSFDEFQYFTGVTELPDYAFNACTSMTSLVLPKNLTRLGRASIRFCQSLTSIEIPDGVKEIGEYAFDNDIKLEKIFIPASVEIIGSNPFTNCEVLSEIVVDNNNPIYDSRNNCNAIIETATNTLLQGCNGTQLPSSLTKIADYALSGFGGFTCNSLDLSNITSVGASAFSGTNLTGTLNIPATLVEIGNGAFSGSFTAINVASGNPVYDSRDNCNAVIESASNKLIIGCSTTQIPVTVSSIGDAAFRNVKELGNVVIPSTVKSIGSAAFNGSDIKSIVIPEGVTVIPVTCFAGCEELESVTLPSTVNEIALYSFANATKLKNINLPEGLTIIGEGAFIGFRDLETIDLPSTLTSIGRDAFWGNVSGNITFIIRAINPPTITMWNNTPNLPSGDYFVPAESIDAYLNAPGWSQIGYYQPLSSYSPNLSDTVETFENEDKHWDN